MGTTVLLDALARHPAFTSHRYSDYPAVFTPYWWNRLRPQVLPRAGVARERAHGDRIAVGLDSPEAFEETLWMAFIQWLQCGERDAWLAADFSAPAFERFHRDHLRNLLRVRGATRYVAKANTLLTRLPYLQRLYPDARFVLPVCEPLAHMASLVRQDACFISLAASDPQVAPHLARTGHFEFGPQKRAVRGADAAQARHTEALCRDGRTALGYATQWHALYGGVLAQLQRDPALRAACLIVPYDALCATPHTTLRGVFTHAHALDDAGERVVAAVVPTLSAPSYYADPIAPSDAAQVRRAARAGRRQPTTVERRPLHRPRCRARRAVHLVPARRRRATVHRHHGAIPAAPHAAGSGCAVMGHPRDGCACARDGFALDRSAHRTRRQRRMDRAVARERSADRARVRRCSRSAPHGYATGPRSISPR